MGLVPEITGIGNQINPARLIARAVAINMKRERQFPGDDLEFYEKTPTGNTLLLTLAVDWCAVPDDSDELRQNDWKFEIIATAVLTDAISNKTAFMKIGDLKFKGVKRSAEAGNRGVWKFVTEMI